MPRRPSIRERLAPLGRLFGELAFAVAPQAVARRHELRTRMAMLDRAASLSTRDAGKSDRFRGAKWLTSRLSPDSEAELDLETIRDRARDLALNDPLAAGFLKTRVTQIVGTGMTYQARVRPDEPGEWPAADRAAIDEPRAERINRQLESLARRQFRALSVCGRRSLWQILRLALKCLDRDGEVFLVFSDQPRGVVPLPLAVEVVSCTRVETPPDKLGHPNCRLGIERDEHGTPRFYHVRSRQPNDTKHAEIRYTAVPAARVCHLYEPEEPDQSRGYSAMQPAMGKFKDRHDVDEAEVMKRQIQACFAVFVQDESGSPIRNAINAATGADASGNRLEQIAPGMINYLSGAQDVKFANPGANASGGEEWYAGQDRQIAASVNMPYEMLVKAWGGTNYSSGRLGLLDGRAEFRVLQQLLVEQFLHPLALRLVRQAVAFGAIDLPARDFLLRRDRFGDHVWIPPGWPWVDPLKEAAADKLAIAERLCSRTDRNAALGRDDDEVQEQIFRERKRDAEREARLREYRQSLGLDPDPATTAKATARPTTRTETAR